LLRTTMKANAMSKTSQILKLYNYFIHPHTSQHREYWPHYYLVQKWLDCRAESGSKPLSLPKKR
jgi:hypothetical protein